MPATTRAEPDAWGWSMLDEAASAALRTITSAPEAWSRRDDVEALHGADVLAGLESAGWVVAWDRPDYRAVCLTTIAAIRLNVVIIERGPDEVPFWGEPYMALRPIRIQRRLGDPLPLERPDLIAARPEPDDDYLLDEVSGEALVLLGQMVRRDKRIRPAKVKRRKGKAA